MNAPMIEPDPLGGGEEFRPFDGGSELFVEIVAAQPASPN